MESAGFSHAGPYPSQGFALPQRHMSSARPISPRLAVPIGSMGIRLSQTLLAGRAQTKSTDTHKHAKKSMGSIPTHGRQKHPPCWPPLGRPRSDTAFAQGEAVPSSNAPERCAILIAHTIGLPDVGLTLQTSLIYNHIFMNLKRTKYEQNVTSTKLAVVRHAVTQTF